jgi:hypothetical protein
MSQKPNSIIKNNGQVIIEFTFCMIIILLMIYGLMMVFRWTGVDLAERRRAHDTVLMQDINVDYGGCAVFNSMSGVCLQEMPQWSGPLKQIDPYFYVPMKINAVWQGN